MSIWKGDVLQMEIWGESHSPSMGVRVLGMPATQLDKDALSHFLARRKAKTEGYSTSRIEADIPVFAGLSEGVLGSDWFATITNNNRRSGDYANLYARPRPGHADYAWYLKDGALDFAGGGRFSGRLTAPLCVAGGVAKQILAAKGVEVHAYVSSIGDVVGLSYKHADYTWDQTLCDTLAPQKGEEMMQAILAAKEQGDSLGGRIECVVRGYPAGLGDNLFGGLEGKMASLLYAVPAVKGVEFGDGFDLCLSRASQVNDALQYNADGQVVLASNHMGGINGGISNGNDLTLAVAIKPTPSISRPQQTVDLQSHQNVTITISGRHDACIVPRAVPVIESAVCLALLDQLLAEQK